MSIEREFSREEFAARIERDLLGCEEKRERKRQIESGALFLEFGGRERDDDFFVAALRRFEFVVAASA